MPVGARIDVLTLCSRALRSSRIDVTRRVLDVVSPGDAVALGVPIRYRGEVSTVRLDTTETTVVVDDGAGGPVVIHRTVLP